MMQKLPNDKQVVSTLIVALRFLQAHQFGASHVKAMSLAELKKWLVPEDELPLLYGAEIDDLCEQLNLHDIAIFNTNGSGPPPTPIYKLTPQERFKLMFKGVEPAAPEEPGCESCEKPHRDSDHSYRMLIPEKGVFGRVCPVCYRLLKDRKIPETNAKKEA